MSSPNKTLPTILLCIAIFALAGCREREEGRQSRSIVEFAMVNGEKLETGEPVETSSSKEARWLHLLKLRNSDRAAYVAEAEKELAREFDDTLAGDVLSIYAEQQDDGNFRRLGMEFGKRETDGFLQVAEIARNGKWREMQAEFAKRMLEQNGNNWHVTYRLARFLAEAGEDTTALKALSSIEHLCEKQYQKEDLRLLRAQLSAKRGALDADETNSLRDLAEHAMMPKVRQQAAELLEQETAK